MFGLESWNKPVHLPGTSHLGCYGTVQSGWINDSSCSGTVLFGWIQYTSALCSGPMPSDEHRPKPADQKTVEWKDAPLRKQVSLKLPDHWEPSRLYNGIMCTVYSISFCTISIPSPLGCPFGRYSVFCPFCPVAIATSADKSSEIVNTFPFVSLLKINGPKVESEFLSRWDPTTMADDRHYYAAPEIFYTHNIKRLSPAALCLSVRVTSCGWEDFGKYDSVGCLKSQTDSNWLCVGFLSFVKIMNLSEKRMVAPIWRSKQQDSQRPSDSRLGNYM